MSCDYKVMILIPLVTHENQPCHLYNSSYLHNLKPCHLYKLGHFGGKKENFCYGLYLKIILRLIELVIPLN